MHCTRLNFQRHVGLNCQYCESLNPAESNKVEQSHDLAWERDAFWAVLVPAGPWCTDCSATPISICATARAYARSLRLRFSSPPTPNLVCQPVHSLQSPSSPFHPPSQIYHLSLSLPRIPGHPPTSPSDISTTLTSTQSVRIQGGIATSDGLNSKSQFLLTSVAAASCSGPGLASLGFHGLALDGRAIRRHKADQDWRPLPLSASASASACACASACAGGCTRGAIVIATARWSVAALPALIRAFSHTASQARETRPVDPNRISPNSPQKPGSSRLRASVPPCDTNLFVPHPTFAAAPLIHLLHIELAPQLCLASAYHRLVRLRPRHLTSSSVRPCHRILQTPSNCFCDRPRRRTLRHHNLLPNSTIRLASREINNGLALEILHLLGRDCLCDIARHLPRPPILYPLRICQ